MLRLFFGLSMLALIEGGLAASTATAPMAWPHRAILNSTDGRPVAFRAYTLGGELIIAVDSLGQYTTVHGPIPTVRALTAADTIRAVTSANFVLDLEKGPVVFVAEGSDSLNILVVHNPWPNIDNVSAFTSMSRVRATGRMFTVSLARNKYTFVIDKR